MCKAATLAGLLVLGIAFLASAGSDAMVAPPAASGPALAGSTTVETVALRKRGAHVRRSALARKAALRRAIAAKNRHLAKARAIAAKNRHAATKSRGTAVTSRHAAVKLRGAIKSRKVAVAKRGATAKTRQAAVARRGVAVRKSQVAASPVTTVGRGDTRDLRTTMVERPIRPWVPQPYYGVVIAGVTLGTVVAATSVPPSPTFDVCWYWSNPPKTRGYWDYCN